MSDSDFSISVWTTISWRFGFILATAVAIAVISLIVYVKISSTAAVIGKTGQVSSRAEALMVLFGTSLIGAIVGDLSGSSQESMAGQLVPAILAMLGLLSVYIFGQKHDESRLVNIAVLAFIIPLAICYSVALAYKGDKDAFIFCRDKYSDYNIIGNENVFNTFNVLFHDYCGASISRHTEGTPPPPN